MIAALHKALRDVLRIALSRGARLPEPCDHGETEERATARPAAGPAVGRSASRKHPVRRIRRGNADFL
ncbi:hypothetical protein AB0D04_01125 [Streptomyces sp. NPDC048483]|uniref:hypothetical protein n=1 Tax=Streptomyces sp. NPDC048483 TaxID=3154927 RepID=UPI003416C652